MRNNITIAALMGLVTLLIACKTNSYVANVHPHNYEVNPWLTDGVAEYDSIIAPYKASLDQEMDEVLGANLAMLYKSKPNGSLGNWMVDALYNQSYVLFTDSIDFTVLNYGGIRIPNLPEGDVTRRNIYELMPFENKVSKLNADGRIVNKLVKRIVNYGGWPISEHLLIKVSDQDTLAYLNGDVIDHNARYTFLITDYVANGGDRCDFLSEAKREDSKVLLRDVFINELMDLTTNGKLIEVSSQDRIVYE